YRLFAVRAGDDNAIVALAGLEVMTNLYHLRHVWVYDLVTTEAARSHGYGAALMRYIEEFARTQGCDGVAMSSGLQRADAHRFYSDVVKMNRTGYTFYKILD
ncbi:MAG: GNAT family N-acetyltransferase, partial [Chloroflexi bacterium]|nr:GNAT family N-acetyltransferase [Chloroflexota bacterium]